MPMTCPISSCVRAPMLARTLEGLYFIFVPSFRRFYILYFFFRFGCLLLPQLFIISIALICDLISGKDSGASKINETYEKQKLH